MKYCAELQEDVTTRMEEQSFAFLQTVREHKGAQPEFSPSTKDQTLTTLYLCEEVKCGRAGGLEEEDLSEGETVKSQLMLEQLPKQGERRSIKHKAKEPEGTREHPATWRRVRAKLAGVRAQRGKALGASAEVKTDCDSKARGRAGANARRTASKTMQSGLARDEDVCVLGSGECQGLSNYSVRPNPCPTSLSG
uniref:Uncharacterized protein n=1 Tax=Ananas comosus var. bracteatus TaxID=296719 RepID=A0A6V7Q2X3_ANACO|nr:unnamed protein product [Ananas comosus var. bracteatus]